MYQTKFINTRPTVKKGRIDLVSSLPQDVGRKILECLPLEEAVRTSILSTRWRYEWSNLTHIILDEQFYTTVVEERVEESDIVTTYANIVNNVLICHVGPLRKIVLYIPECLESNDQNIYQWLRFVSGKNVSEVTLIGNRNELRTLLSMVFRNEGLTRLTLHNCRIPTLRPSLTVFPCLISLELFGCHIGSTNVLESLISSCLQLRLLQLNFCDLNSMDTATNLSSNYIMQAKMRELQVQLHFIRSMYVHFDFSSSQIACQCLRLGPLFFSTPKLACSINQNRKTSERFNPRALELAGVRYHYRCVKYFVLQLLNTESQFLQRLYCQFSELGSCRDRIPPHDPCCNNPNIEHGNLPSLKYVEIVRVTDTINELQFIKRILKCAPLLEVMTIKVSEKVTEAEDKMKIAINCMQYPRASSNAQIIFKP